MSGKPPPSIATLGVIGFSLIAYVIVGGLLGFMVFKYAHWGWALPAGILVGFVLGFLSMFRQLGRLE